MKFLFILIFILSFNLNGLSQKSDDAVIYFNQPKKEMYWRFDNYLYCSHPGFFFEDIEVKTNNEKVEIEKLDNKWRIKPPIGLKELEFQFYHKGDLFHNETYKSIPYKYTDLYLGKYKSGEMAKVDELIRYSNYQCFEAELHSSNLDPTYIIDKLEIEFYISENLGQEVKKIDYSVEGACLDDRAIKILKNKDVIRMTCNVHYLDQDSDRHTGKFYLNFIDNIKNELSLQKSLVIDKDLELFERELILIEQDSILTDQQEALDVNFNEIREQKNEMQEQSAILDNQLVQINSQRNLLLIFIGIVLIVSVLLFIAYRNYRQKKLAMKEVIGQKNVIELAHINLAEKNKEILDSIAYAKRIQTAILPPLKLVKTYLNDSFILYKPKDVVAGDFYWMETQGNRVLFAAADCTGHGVPGAMVSVICNNSLNRSVREFKLTDPGEILTKTRELVVQEFEKSEEEVKDGMDVALCSLEGNKLKFAGAHNPLWIIRKQSKEIEEIKADKQPIGRYAKQTPFTSHEVDLSPGDTFYTFSDGFADQFGGVKGKKFKSKNFKELLLSIQDESMERQKEHIDEVFENWRGHLEQLDDVCVIGVRV